MERTNAERILKACNTIRSDQEPLHGYQILKHVRKRTLGVITPTTGALYPALKELEDKGIVMGEWRLNERRKVYHVTGKGRGVFREAVQRHFELVSSIRDWFLKELTELKVVEQVELPPIMPPAARVLLLDENASTEERIAALENLKAQLQRVAPLLHEMMDQITLRIEELKSSKA